MTVAIITDPMSRTSYLLVVARLEAERRRKLGVIASATHLELAAVENIGSTLSWLEHHEPEVVAFDSSMPKAEQLCHKLRSRKAWGRVPMIALAAEPSDAHVEKLFSLGVDDVVPLSAWPAFIARLRALPRVESIQPPPGRGKAIVADPERERCDVVGRVLTNAGFDVRAALDRRALEYYSLQNDVALIVANVELGDMRNLVEQARKSQSTAAWVVASRRRDLDEHARSLADLERVAVAPATGAPESVLFVANELLSNRRTARQSTRVLCGTLVSFRPAGTETDDLGFSYNVSENGLYVRTLAPPEGDEVWLELSPPKHNRRVRLLGRVVWRRGFEGNTGASVPPGFGVQLLDGLGEGLSQWQEGYLTLDGASVSGTADRPQPPPKPEGYRRKPADRPPPPAGPDDAEPQITAIAPPLGSEPELPRVSAPSIEVGPPQSITEELLENPPAAPVRTEPTVMEARPETPAAPAAESRSAGGLALLLALVVVAAGAAVFVLWQRGTFGGGHAPAPAAPEATAHPKPEPPAPKTASAAAPSASAPAAPEPTADLSKLTPTQGYLYVKTSLDANVYINGRSVGPTNKPVMTGCGMHFVRVGKAGGVWLSAGRAVKIECGKLTKAAFSPSPPPAKKK